MENTKIELILAIERNEFREKMFFFDADQSIKKKQSKAHLTFFF